VRGVHGLFVYLCVCVCVYVTIEGEVGEGVLVVGE